MGSEIKGCCSEVYCYMRLVQIIEETVHFSDKRQHIHHKNFIEDKGEVTNNQRQSGIYLHIDTWVEKRKPHVFQQSVHPQGNCFLIYLS